MKVFKCDKCCPGCLLKVDDNQETPSICPWSLSECNWKDITNDIEEDKQEWIDKIYNECLNMSIRLKG